MARAIAASEPGPTRSADAGVNPFKVDAHCMLPAMFIPSGLTMPAALRPSLVSSGMSRTAASATRGSRAGPGSASGPSGK
jgi:hypothetical protein